MFYIIPLKQESASKYGGLPPDILKQEKSNM